jgi:hypothetical protein
MGGWEDGREGKRKERRKEGRKGGREGNRKEGRKEENRKEERRNNWPNNSLSNIGHCSASQPGVTSPAMGHGQCLDIILFVTTETRRWRTGGNM